MRYILVLLSLSLINPAESFSQQIRPVMDKLADQLDSSVQKNVQTAVYLSVNKDIYIGGEDLWFNAFVLNAQVFTLSSLDKTLYVQLQQRGSDSIVWQEMYAIVDGLSSGHIYLPQTLREGDYLLKAYTAHSFFAGQPYFYAVAPIRLVQQPGSIKRQRHDEAAPQKNDIQFTLFPEGGSLIAGLQNRVAFKAVAGNGRPAAVSGTLFKGSDAVLHFSSLHAGMGSFVFTPQQNMEYRIRLENNVDSFYTLPKIEDNGIVMNLVKNESDSLVFKINSNRTLDKKNIFLRLQVRGMIQAIAAGILKDSLTIKIPVKNSPPGIAEATLFDEQLRPLAERLVYLHAGRQLNISISPVKERYAEKEKISIKIRTTDPNGNGIPAVLSLRVYDELFTNPSNTRDIVNYYFLSTQLRGNIYDPSYYFDSTHSNGKEAFDLLLLTQGWRRYTWNKDVLEEQAANNKWVVTDSLQANLVPVKNAGKEKKPISLIFFNYNKSVTQLAATDVAGRFYLAPENLLIGPRFFIKYLSEKEYRVKITDPFDNIKTAEARYSPVYALAEKYLPQEKTVIDTGDLLQYGKTLAAVTVLAKGRGYSDKYMGYLDSVARYEGNTDYVGACGWLNCPDGPTDIKPIEGKKYNVFASSVKTHRKVVLTSDNYRTVIYQYPKFTEEELLQKFKMSVVKGYYQSREYYEPDYDKENNSVPDDRNTLAWNPSIVTDANGEAIISFFSSDIHSRFIGIIEGVDGEGLLGVNKFNFSVR